MIRVNEQLIEFFSFSSFFDFFLDDFFYSCRYVFDILWIQKHLQINEKRKKNDNKGDKKRQDTTMRFKWKK